MPNLSLQKGLTEIARLFRLRRFNEARILAVKISELKYANVDVWLMLARVEQQLQNFPAMLAATQKAQSIRAGNLTTELIYIEALGYCGKVAEALAAVQKLEAPDCNGDAGADAWRKIAGMHSHLSSHQSANVCLRKAQKVGGDTVNTLLALASSEMVLGNLGESETIFDQSIQKFPNEYEAYYTRATLRRQTKGNNHIETLQETLRQAEFKGQFSTLAPLHYALAKELEDIEEWEASFEHVAAGSRLRRKVMAYKVENDLDTIANIRAAFGADFLAQKGNGFTNAQPIFVVGLPRSGTTLVDRILSCAPNVESLGEINDFAFALMRLAGPPQGKSDLITRAATSVDLRELGGAYMRASRGYGHTAHHLIDKTPVNALYVGLIATALPNAKIIHVHRHPMANAYATYKTLFRMGYPWSYSLQDIGKYISAHMKLMDHWRTLLPNRIIEIKYESLIADQEGVSRSLFEKCGLTWSNEYLAFHKNKSPVSTASAAQVRKPIYNSSVDLWRRYEHQLDELRSAYFR